MQFSALISMYDGEKNLEFCVNCTIKEAYDLAEKMMNDLAHPDSFVRVTPAEDIKSF